jgi:hypothetical protein
MNQAPMIPNHDIHLLGPQVIGRSIWVTFQKEGIHCYPDAATNPDLEDVSFLAHPHRHIFHFRVEVPVEHNDRDIEFIQFKRWCEAQYDDGTLELNHKSCEMLAQELGENILETYNVSWVNVMVSEDDENGATVVMENFE